MRNRLSFWLLAVLLSATSAFAEFEGVLTLNLSVVGKDGHEQGGGTINLAIAKAGMRGQISLQLGPGAGMNSVVLCKTDTPNTNYVIADAQRSYTEVDLTPPLLPTGRVPAQPRWTVQKLGRKKLLGYKTEHVLARKPGSGQSVEMWLATDLLDYETYSRLQAGSGEGMGSDTGLSQALKEAGVAGMPLKAVITTEDGGKVKMEAVKAEKKSLPASTFEIPAGYTKSVSSYR